MPPRKESGRSQNQPLTVLRDAVRRMWSEAGRSGKRYVAAALLLMLGSSLVAALAPLLLKLLVETVGADRSYVSNFGPTHLIIAYALAHCVSRSLAEWRGMALGRADQRMSKNLSDECFQHVMSLPLRFHLKRETGALVQTLSNGLIGYRTVMLHLVNSVLPIVIEVASMGAVLLFLGHGSYLAIIGTSIVLYALAFWLGAIRVNEPAREVSTAHIQASAIFTDSILNYETVKYFTGEALVRNRFMTALRHLEDRWTELYARKMHNGLVVAIIFALSLGLSLYVAANAVARGTMSIGDFVLVNAYVMQLVLPLERIGFAFRDIAQGVSFIEKMAELAHVSPESYRVSPSSPASEVSADLIFDHVSFAYDKGRPVLQDISFTVARGNTLAVVGASGSGKSSLVRLLLRLVDPDSGSICVGSTNLSDIPLGELRQRIAVVPQDPIMFNESIGFNIAFGKPGCSEEEIVEAAKIANLHNLILTLPNSYGTRVGERGIRLSGGERQRLAIARAVIRKPDILVLDEFTSALDSHTERKILSKVLDVSGNTKTIIIAHRLSSIVHANEIIVLDEGRIIERGTHQPLLEMEGTYLAMWLNQLESTVSPFDRCTCESV